MNLYIDEADGTRNWAPSLGHYELKLENVDEFIGPKLLRGVLGWASSFY